jgi:hypothetical protein
VRGMDGNNFDHEYRTTWRRTDRIQCIHPK